VARPVTISTVAPGTSWDQERRLEQALERRAETLDCIVAARASTPDGLRVKAEALVLVALRYAWQQEDKALEEVARSGDAGYRLALSLAWPRPIRRLNSHWRWMREASIGKSHFCRMLANIPTQRSHFEQY